MTNAKPARSVGDTPQCLDDILGGDREPLIHVERGGSGHGPQSSLRLPDSAIVVVAPGHASFFQEGDDGAMDAPLDYTAIAERIRMLRKERQQNQYDVAAAAGVSRPVVSEWEKGRKKPGREKLVAVAKHFGVPVDFLLYGDRQPGTIRIQSSQEERLVLLSRRVSPDVRKAVETILENAADAEPPSITKR